MSDEPRPTQVAGNAERAYQLLGPLTRRDPSTGWPLLKLLAALGRADQPVWELAEDPGIGAMTPENADTDWLPLLAQIVGARLSPAMPETEQRAEIDNPSGWRRGTVPYLTARIQQRLTDTKLVVFLERDTSAYHVTIRTRTTETPDPAAIERDLKDPVRGLPAGITFTHIVSDSPIWAEATLSWDDAASVAWEDVTSADVT